MLINKKIRAFTIAEMIVVLVLSGIVISIAILVLNLVQNQIFGIQNNMEKQSEVLLLERTLWQDFSANRIGYDKRNKILYCISPLDTINYVFTKEFVIRNQDTITIHIKNSKFYLDAHEVTENELDAIELSIDESSREKELFIFQNKDASHYMNYN